MSDGEGALVSLHQLVCCLHTDPHRVFAEGTEVHHRLGHAGLLETPDNLVVLDVDEHRDKHQGDSVDRPLIDIVLGFDE